MINYTGLEVVNDMMRMIAYQMLETIDVMFTALRCVIPGAILEDNRGMDENSALLNRCYYRLRRLAGNLQEVSEIDTPVVSAQSNADIVEVCQNIAEQAEYSAQLLGLTLEFDTKLNRKVIALDQPRVEQLLLHLLSNAFKFTPPGGKVTVEVNALYRHVEIRVSDTGCGISSDEMEHIFDPYHCETIPRGAPHGLGLGLPICRKIAQDHGGTLVISSKEGQGTTVTATLENRSSPMIRPETMIPCDYTGGFNRILMELSDALPKQAFSIRMLD